MNIVLFEEGELASPLPLCDHRVKHIQKILKKGVGDSFDAGIVNGVAGTAEIRSVSPQGMEFCFEASGDGKLLHPVTMIIGFPRPIQLKRLLRDIASLGVSQVHLCGTELGEKSYLKATLSQPEELTAMLKDGSIQAKSTHVPQVFVHQDVASCLDFVAGNTCIHVAGIDSIRVAGNPRIHVALDNIEPTASLQGFLSSKFSADEVKRAGVVAAIGSERGWTDNERQLFRKKGFTLCSMGERVLRTETAATTAVAIILSNMEIL
ncbi:MAG: RsmE family RNA methyltransferase [Treponema sp.]|nr:RsmE family RNA methyltransferase [Treponema sp.]